MAALPYMPLFVADYLADTAHLTAAQHGAYMLLIMNYWQRGKGLPDDDTFLAKVARMSRRDWAHNRESVLAFFTKQESLLVHARIAHELSRVAVKSLKSKKAAQASVQRRFSGRSADVEPTDTDNIRVPLDRESNGAAPDQVFWANAKAYLAPETKGDPGKLIGAWCRDYGGKEIVAQAITRAQLERPVQRIPFIVGCLKQKDNEFAWDGGA